MKHFMLVLIILIVVSNSYQLLADTPVTFKIAGNITYTPSSGGASIPGYIVKVGFYRFSWIGVKFMTLTSRSIYDILIIKRDSNPVGGYYKTTVGDYYVTSGRQDKLLSDTINNMDKQAQTYTNNNYFQVQLYRTKGTTQGQDWQGGQFVSICFYTSFSDFNQNIWTGLIENCYGYDVNSDYISTYRGKYIGSMIFDGLSSDLFGGIQGPLLQMKLFWYCPKPTLSSPNVYFRISDKISDQLGYDYFQCSTGDYFGPDTGSLTQDTLWSGYNDGQCTISSSTRGNKISYVRKIYTNDQFDSTIYNETQICVKIGGSNEVCSTIKLQLLFPVMNVDSALIIWQNSVRYNLLIVLSIGIMCFNLAFD